MAYKIVSSTAHNMVLARESVKGKAGCMVAFGIMFVLVGIALNFLLDSTEMPFILFKILFPLFGLVAVFGGLQLPRQTENSHPEQITFDHDKGAVIIQMTKTLPDFGYIKYSEIAGFDIYEERRTSSSSGRSSSRTYYHYHVYIKKKDGGQWHLMDYSDRGAAEAMVAQFQAQIPLNKPCTLTAAIKLTPKIEKKESPDKTVIHWQNKFSWSQAIFLLLFSCVFLGMLFSFFSFDSISEDGFSWFFLLVAGFILTVFCLVMFTIVRKQVKDATTRYAVSVDHVNLEYYEFGKSSGTMKNKITLPLHLVESIRYTFSPSKQYPDAGLKILTHAQSVRTQAYEQKPLEALKDLFKKKENQPIDLSITALNPVECLQLENWLQELIRKKSHVSVQ